MLSDFICFSFTLHYCVSTGSGGTNNNKMCNITLGFILNSVVLLTKNMPVVSRVKRHNRGVTSAGTLVYPNSLWSMIVLIHHPISAPPLVQMQCQNSIFLTSRKAYKSCPHFLHHDFVNVHHYYHPASLLIIIY